MTAKEIADALRAATSFETDVLEPLEEYRSAKARTGAPTSIEKALINAANECQRAREQLAGCCDAERDAFIRASDTLASGGMRLLLPSFVLTRQNNHEAIVLVEVYRVRLEAFLSALEVFEEVADRIVATPEETAAAEQKRAERARAHRDAAIERWCKLSAKALAATAQARGVDPGSMHKRDVAIALVAAGHLT